jgi:glycosyltransferase involved in cell wall biosynthesis
VSEVSVVIPTRDRPQLLALTLRTVLWQQDVDAEVLVVDDGVSQAAAAVVERLGDSKLQVLRNSSTPGVGGARNCGILAARSEWISFLDDDDLWAPGKLASQLAAVREMGADWAYGGDVTVDEGLHVVSGAAPLPPEEVRSQLQRYNAVPAGASNVIVRRRLLDAVGTFDTGLRTSEDWDLWLRLAARSRPACVPRPLVALRAHGGMASRAVDQMLADVEVVARRYGIAVDRARHQRWAAWMCLEDGRRGRALRHYAKAAMAGDLASVGRAAVALVYPQVASGKASSTDDWAREAQTWLNVLRASRHEGE